MQITEPPMEISDEKIVNTKAYSTSESLHESDVHECVDGIQNERITLHQSFRLHCIPLCKVSK